MRAGAEFARYEGRAKGVMVGGLQMSSADSAGGAR